MSYPIGTVVIGQNCVNDIARNGMEAVVIGGLETRVGKNVLGVVSIEMMYLVKRVDNRITVVPPHHLRKKQPPSGEHSILAMFTRPVSAGTLQPH